MELFIFTKYYYSSQQFQVVTILCFSFEWCIFPMFSEGIQLGLKISK